MPDIQEVSAEQDESQEAVVGPREPPVDVNPQVESRADGLDISSDDSYGSQEERKIPKTERKKQKQLLLQPVESKPNILGKKGKKKRLAKRATRITEEIKEEEETPKPAPRLVLPDQADYDDFDAYMDAVMKVCENK